MPTYAQLAKEPWWNAEYPPPSLEKLRTDLLEFFQIGPKSIGIKGDNKHMKGYHRSRAWIRNSRYCTGRTYSTTETPGNRGGGDDNWLCALDISVPDSILIPMCQRLDGAVRAGRLEKVTEWYGNDDGDNRVDGYNNIQDRVATSDSSHLWHLHISFDRGRAGEDHADLFAVLTGTEDDMPNPLRADNDFHALIERVENIHNLNEGIPADAPNKGEGSPLVVAIRTLLASAEDTRKRLEAIEKALGAGGTGQTLAISGGQITFGDPAAKA